MTNAHMMMFPGDSINYVYICIKGAGELQKCKCTCSDWNTVDTPLCQRCDKSHARLRGTGAMISAMLVCTLRIYPSRPAFSRLRLI
jgi:hypothetical protein